MSFIAPSVFEKKFTCPHCGAIALQRWQESSWNLGSTYGNTDLNLIRVSRCDHCNESALWLHDKLVFPDSGIAPSPNPDLPESVKSIYLEAASISSKSPRGAAGLLRLALQVFIKELGEEGKNINSDIASLVKKGLPERLQQAFDIVRVTGNNAVHPGQIDVDSPETVANLFSLINVIAEYMVSMPRRISGIYAALPATAHEQINKRDATL